MKSISLFVDNGTYLTKVHPFTKLMYIAAAISIPLISGRLWMFGVFIAVSLLVLASGKILKKTLPLIAFSFTILLTIFLIHGLFNQKNVNVLFQVVGLKFYREGIFYALHIGLNILNMLLSFAVFVLSTKPSEFVDELEKRGFSPRFGYIVTSVFQIIPQMMGTMNTIMDAQRSRGLETEGNLRTRGKAFLPLISPVVMSSLPQSQVVNSQKASGIKEIHLLYRLPSCFVLILFTVLPLIWDKKKQETFSDFPLSKTVKFF